jgi:FkbM family methyltransferase
MTVSVTEQNHDTDLTVVLNHPCVQQLAKRGVIHIGAHQGQEVPHYLNHGFENIVLIEANPEWYQYLVTKFGDEPRIKIFHCAICDRDGTIDLHIHTSRSGSTEPASILPLKRFGEIVKTLHTPNTVTVNAVKLDTLMQQHGLQAGDFNFINIDIQGAELLAFKGAVKTLEHIDAIISEVNVIEMYDGGPLEGELIQFLEERGFAKVNANYHELYDESSRFAAWGECFLVKKKFLSSGAGPDQ